MRFPQFATIFNSDSQRNADILAKQVKVRYSDICKPIITIEDAIEQKSFHPPRINDFAIGNTDSKYIHASCFVNQHSMFYPHDMFC